MSGKKYKFRREGNHFKLSIPIHEEISPKKQRFSFKFSTLKKFFNFLFSGIVFMITYLLITPFFLLSVIWNWALSSISLSIFWMVVCAIYGTFFIERQTKIEPFTNTSIPVIIIVSLIIAILITIDKMRE